MKYIKVTLSEIVPHGGTAREISLYLVPQADEYDEDGLPIFDEEIVRQHPDTRKFANKIKSSVIALKYTIYEANTNIKTAPEVFADFAEIEKNGVSELGGNDFNIDVKKRAQFYGDTANSGKSGGNNLAYVALIAVIVVIAGLSLYPSIVRKTAPPVQSDVTSDSVSDSVSDITTDGEQSSEPKETSESEITTTITAVAEPAKTTEPQETTIAVTEFDLSDPARTVRTAATSEIIVVTDESGQPVTDENGEFVTAEAEPSEIAEQTATTEQTTTEQSAKKKRT